MKRLLFTLLLLATFAQAQNLIPNSDFSTGTCAAGPANWTEQGLQPLDYHLPACPPTNWQPPQTPPDPGYVGVFAWQQGGAGVFQEWWLVRLPQPLSAGSYTISFQAALSPSSCLLTNSLSIYAFTGPQQPFIGNQTAPLFTHPVAPASDAWMDFASAHAIVQGTEWIAIGGSYPDNGSSQPVTCVGNFQGTYFWIDDFCLSVFNGQNLECGGPVAVDPPAQAQPIEITVRGSSLIIADSAGTVCLYDLSGEKVGEKKCPARFDGLRPGVYIARIEGRTGKALVL